VLRFRHILGRSSSTPPSEHRTCNHLPASSRATFLPHRIALQLVNSRVHARPHTVRTITEGERRVLSTPRTIILFENAHRVGCVLIYFKLYGTEPVIDNITTVREVLLRNTGFVACGRALCAGGTSAVVVVPVHTEVT